MWLQKASVYHFIFHPDQKSDYSRYILNLDKWLSEIKPERWLYSQEKSADGSHHCHCVIELERDYDTSNVKAWRTKLLEDTLVTHPRVALVVTHGLPYINYIGYACKEVNPTACANTPPEMIAKAREQHADHVFRSDAAKFMKGLRIIPPAHLQAMRYFAKATFGKNVDYHLARVGFTCADPSFDGSAGYEKRIQDLE